MNGKQEPPDSGMEALPCDNSFESRQAKAYDNLLPIYEARHEGCQDIRRTVLGRVLAGLSDDATVLDVGCGAGAYLELMVQRGLKAEGVDLSESMAKAARERSGAVVTTGDFLKLNLEGPFDLVFAQAFVHLFPKADALRIIEKLKSLAKKRVYFSTSLRATSGEGWEEKDGVKRYRSRYTQAEFSDLIRASAKVGNWKATSFELVDPEQKRWLQVILDRV